MNKEKILYYLNIFFIFSIFGHILENFVYVHVDSGILYGFWTPIYGTGVLLIMFIHRILKKFNINKYIYPFILFILSAVTLSALEYLGGTVIELLFGRVFWDYSSEAFNIGKYTSLKMCLLWGISSILLIYIVMPILNNLIKKIPKFITYILVFLFIFDLIYTFVNLVDFNLAHRLVRLI